MEEALRLWEVILDDSLTSVISSLGFLGLVKINEEGSQTYKREKVEMFNTKLIESWMEAKRQRTSAGLKHRPRNDWWKPLVGEVNCDLTEFFLKKHIPTVVDDFLSGLEADITPLEETEKNAFKTTLNDTFASKRDIIMKNATGIRESANDFAFLQDRKLQKFVGRDLALYTFVDSYVLRDIRVADRDKSDFCATAGSPGIGKTRFLEQLAAFLLMPDLLEKLIDLYKRCKSLPTLTSVLKKKPADIIVPREIQELASRLGGTFPILITFNTQTPLRSVERSDIFFYTGVRMLLS